MCGIGGEVTKHKTKVHIARRAKNSGTAINYRGNESAGICMTDGLSLRTQKGFGSFDEAVPSIWAEMHKGLAAIFQNRYSTTGTGVSLKDREGNKPVNPLIEFEDMENPSPGLANCQPFFCDYTNKQGLQVRIAVVHNGNLTNLRELKMFLASKGISKFITETDTELILRLIAYYLENQGKKSKRKEHKIASAIRRTMLKLRGAYSCLLLTNEGIWAFRDPKGIRPLKIAETYDSFMFASEAIAWHGRDAEFLGNVTPGQIVEARIGCDKLKYYTALKPQKRAFCVFEDIYLQAGYNEKVCSIRKAFGHRLFELYPLPGIVMPILNSGKMAAMGYHNAQTVHFPGQSFYWEGLFKNPHVGRTFLEPSKDDRVEKNKKKYFRLFGAISEEIHCLIKKNGEAWIIFIDDSLVRANVSRTLIKLIRQELKKCFPDVYPKIRIAWLLSSPPYSFPCYYGVDTYEVKDLIAARFNCNIDQIRRSINASFLGYLSIKDMKAIAAKVHGLKPNEFCDACFSGDYPIKIDGQQHKMSLAALND